MRIILLIAVAFLWVSPAFALSLNPFGCGKGKTIKSKQCICKKSKGVDQDICKKELNVMVKRKEAAIERETAQINAGNQSGNTGTILNLAGLGGGGGVDDAGAGLTSLVGIKNKHYVDFGMSIYFLPSEPGYKRQMPDRIFPNQLAYHYYLNPNWSAGLMWQDYTLKGTLFDPVTEKRMVDEEVIVIDPVTGAETVEIRSVEKSVVIQQPGSDTMQIQRLFGVMAFHVDISSEVELEILGGYNLIYNVTYKTDGYADEKFSPPKPFMMSIAAGYKPVDSDYMFTAGVRFVDSPTDAPNLMDYHNPGGAEVFFGTRLGVM